jgi:hypothetical protein
MSEYDEQTKSIYDWYLELDNLSSRGENKFEVENLQIAGLGDFSLPIHIVDQVTLNLLNLPKNMLYFVTPGSFFSTHLFISQAKGQLYSQIKLFKGFYNDQNPRSPLFKPFKTFFVGRVIFYQDHSPSNSIGFQIQIGIEYKYSISN